MTKILTSKLLEWRHAFRDVTFIVCRSLMAFNRHFWQFNPHPSPYPRTGPRILLFYSEHLIQICRIFVLMFTREQWGSYSNSDILDVCLLTHSSSLGTYIVCAIVRFTAFACLCTSIKRMCRAILWASQCSIFTNAKNHPKDATTN